MAQMRAADAQQVTAAAILSRRSLYLQEMNTQIRYDTVHARVYAATVSAAALVHC